MQGGTDLAVQAAWACLFTSELQGTYTHDPKWKKAGKWLCRDLSDGNIHRISTLMENKYPITLNASCLIKLDWRQGKGVRLNYNILFSLLSNWRKPGLQCWPKVSYSSNFIDFDHAPCLMQEHKNRWNGQSSDHVHQWNVLFWKIRLVPPHLLVKIK